MREHRLRWSFFVILSSILCFCLGAEADDFTTGAVVELPAIDSGETVQVAQRSGRRRRKKSRRRRKKSSRKRSAVNSGIKAGAGLVFGIEGASPFMLGGDYTMPIKSVPNLLIDVGGNYWSYSVASVSVTFITLEGGVDYHYPVTRAGKILGGARLSYVNASGGGASDSKFGFTLLGGYEHNLGGSAIGGEFRIPMVSDLDVTYLFGYYKFFL